MLTKEMKCNQARAKNGKPESHFPKHVKGRKQIQPESTIENRIPFSFDSQGPVEIQGQVFSSAPIASSFSHGASSNTERFLVCACPCGTQGRAKRNILLRGFPGGTVFENLPANAGDTGSSPGLGRSHMPQSD